MFYRKPRYEPSLVTANEIDTGDHVFLCTSTEGRDVEFFYPGVFVHRIEKDGVDDPTQPGLVRVFFWDDYVGEALNVILFPTSLVSRNQVQPRRSLFRFLLRRDQD